MEVLMYLCQIPITPAFGENNLDLVLKGAVPMRVNGGVDAVTVMV